MHLTRRHFMTGAAGVAVGTVVGAAVITATGPRGDAALGAARLAGASDAASAGACSVPEVVAFFQDQLWLDGSGLSPAYVAPTGARGGAQLAALTDDDLYRLYGRI